jgi:hypothetical protein
MLNPNSRWPTQTLAPTVDYPYGLAQNITTPGDGTGTPFVADLVNDLWGLQQELVQRAGITPSGVPDHAGDSDVFNAMRRTCGYPGLIVPCATYADPATLGLRLLELDGSGILIASYPDLVTACYIGDANNADANADAFYKSSDAAGTSRTTAGPYMKLPDMRGKFLRGSDLSASVDPEAANRGYHGTNQTDQIENHEHPLTDASAMGATYWYWNTTNTIENTTGGDTMYYIQIGSTGGATQFIAYDSTPSDPLGTETRPINVNAGWYIWY